MFQNFNSLVKIPDLRKRILFVLAICIVYRIGGMIPVPGIDAKALLTYMNSLNNTLFGMYDMFVGGSFKKMSIFALGIMPYISASIIIQLLGSVVPYFQRLAKEGEVVVYKHIGNWECMDHERDVVHLNKQWNEKKVFWKVW